MVEASQIPKSYRLLQALRAFAMTKNGISRQRLFKNLNRKFLMTAQLYPWQQAIWQRLTAQPETLPHALLLSGHRGLGKFSLAQQFAHWLLCQSPKQGRSCGQCVGCQFQGESHPDQLTVRSLSDARVIKIEQVRQIVYFALQTAQYAHHKVILLENAEQMNEAAQNALLKTLEEPPAGVYLIITTSQPMLLLPTLRSRCLSVMISAPSPVMLKKWLADQGIVDEARQQLLANLCPDAPLAAIKIHDAEIWQLRTQLFEDLLAIRTKRQDIIPISVRLSQGDWRHIISFLLSFWQDCVRAALMPDQSRLINRDYSAAICHLRSGLNLRNLFKLLDQAVFLYQKYEAGRHLNLQLSYDVLLNHWQEI